MERLACGVALLVLLSASPLFAARNVILMIGDGMGPGIIGAGKYYNDLVLRRAPLHLEEVAAKGSTALVFNYSASHLVTDSAAAATAMACGVKTVNGTIGMDEKGKPVETILEYARAGRRATGLVTTSDIVDATPAAFAAHVSHRSGKEEIARQEIAGKVNVLFGGGRAYFDIPAAEKNGYRVARTAKEMQAAAADRSPFVLGLFADGKMSFARQRTAEEPSLAQAAAAALALLSQRREGFFLMIEGGRIDQAAHVNDEEDVLGDFLAFDEALGTVLQFVQGHPDTLLIVTADHDTGGLALTADSFLKGGGYPTREDFGKMKGMHWIGKSHTGSPVPLWMISPDAQRPDGMMDNTGIYRLMRRSLER